MQWALVEESGFLFLSVLKGGEKGNLAPMPAQMTSNLLAQLRAVSIEHKRYTLHSHRVGGAASHRMDGTTMDPFYDRGITFPLFCL